MIRKYRRILIVASVVIMLPMLAGVMLWDRLPAQMPTHWNGAGEIDGWSSRAFAVFGTPLILLATEWFGMAVTAADPRKKAHSEKLLKMVLWIVPAMSVVMNTLIYAAALGKEVRMEMVLPILLGLLFVVTGNYLPKCRQNYTMGIKIPWTLHSEENWNRTHRLAGRIWVAGGIAMLPAGFLGGNSVLAGIVVLVVLVPMVYSYLLHRRGI